MLCVLSAFLLTLLVRSRLRRRSLPATLGIFLIGITVAVIGVKLFQLKEIARIEGLATSEERLTRKMSWNNKQVTLHVQAAFLSGPNERAGQLPGSLMISIEYPELLPRALSAKSKRSEEIIVFLIAFAGLGLQSLRPAAIQVTRSPAGATIIVWQGVVATKFLAAVANAAPFCAAARKVFFFTLDYCASFLR